MKKLIITIVAIIAFMPLNAFEKNEILQDENLSNQISNILEKISKEKPNTYTITGLLYIGDATLEDERKTFSRENLVISQEKGYITYQILSDKKFNSFKLEIIPEANNKQDPHRSNFYFVNLKLFNGKKLVKELSSDAIELKDAGLANEGTFFTNLAVNASYNEQEKKFFVLSQEPFTCGQEIDLRTGPEVKTRQITTTIQNHDSSCVDPRHCSCPYENITATIKEPRAFREFTIYTKQCQTDKACKCPKYINYID